MWLLAILLALFLFFSWFGRQSRLGRLRPAPWIHNFRVLRGFVATACAALGVTMLVRGEIWPGLGALLVAVLLGGSVRFSAQAGVRRPGVAAEYTAEEVQAYKTLGLAVGADRKAIKAAWKDLMKAAHPDQGGSETRAKALNAARDLLLKRR